MDPPKQVRFNSGFVSTNPETRFNSEFVSTNSETRCPRHIGGKEAKNHFSPKVSFYGNFCCFQVNTFVAKVLRSSKASIELYERTGRDR